MTPETPQNPSAISQALTSGEPEKVVITEDNFAKYFFPAKEDYKPQRGQVLARWRAKADFVDGWVKRNVIELLCVSKAGADTAYKVMTKLVSATEREAVRVLREMAEDLAAGAGLDAVAEKPYRFTVEQMYWTEKQYVPDDPHWEVVNVLDLTTKDHPFEVSARVVSGLSEGGDKGTVAE